MGGLLALTRRMAQGAAGPLVSFVALFALPLSGALVLDQRSFAFWAIISTVSSVSLSLDFGGVALLTARYFSEPRLRLLLRCAALSASGALLVGLVASSIWLSLGNSALGSTVPQGEAIAAIVTMTLATAIRSVCLVVAQAALLEESLSTRNIATAGQAVIAAGATLTLLFSTRSYWALPLGWLIAGIIVAPICAVLWARRSLRAGQGITIVQDLRVGRYAVTRTFATVIGAVLLQSDKWIVGAIGGPGALALYEVASRFATLPRFLVQNLAARIGTDSASLSSSDKTKLGRLLRQATAVSAVSLVMASGAVALSYYAFTQLTNVEPSWPIFILLIVAFGALSLSATWSFVGVALGRGGIDIPYAIFALVISAVGAVIAADQSNFMIYVIVYCCGLSLAVGYFFLYAPRSITRGLRSRFAPSNSPTEELKE